MISVIIASVNNEQLANVTENIAQTIGVEFEVIGIANGDGKMGICELYNLGATKAKYDFLCFMHEDVLVKTGNWGSVIINTFNNHPKLGLLGIAGSQYKSAAPSSWYCYENEAPELLNFNLIQRYKYVNKEKEQIYSNPNSINLINVASIDGVWFCCTRAAIDVYPFDQQLLRGFHGYDLDFSLGIGQFFEIGVTFEILIEHFSEGYTDNNWLNDILKVHNKWNFRLPVNIAHLPKEKVSLLEKRGFKSFMVRMRNEGISFSAVKSMLASAKQSKAMNAGLYLKLYLHLVKLFAKKAKTS